MDDSCQQHGSAWLLATSYANSIQLYDGVNRYTLLMLLLSRMLALTWH